MEAFGPPHEAWENALHYHDGTHATSSHPSRSSSTLPNGTLTHHTRQPPHPPPQNPAVLQICPEVKPRLTKEQHEILEKHFRQQPKPSTSVKKGFAEALGVPLDKINNWFQNRRAKVKQDLKKQMNALAIMQGHFSMQSQNQPTFLQVSPPLAAAASTEFLAGNLPTTSKDALPPAAVQPTSSEHMHPPAFPRQSEFNPTIPTILETAQAGSPEDIVQSLQAAGYNVQEPNMISAGVNSENLLAFDTPLAQGFSDDISLAIAAGMNDLVPAFGGLPQHLSQPFDFQSFLPSADVPVESMEHNVPNMRSLNSMSSSTSIASMASLPTRLENAKWAEQSNPSMTFTTTSPSDLDGSSTDADMTPQTEIWPSAQCSEQMFQHKQLYQQSNPSAPMLATPPDETCMQLSPPSISADEFLRRNSSTSALADNLNSVGISAHETGSPVFKEPDQPANIAARRQRPRPAALGAASLRSASYSVGMPASPGASQGLAAPDQQLRRIRSSGVANGGRIQKPPPTSGQRSPLHFSFTEAASSPKFVRHASMQSTVSSPTVSATTGSLAPATPCTPHDFVHWPPWQAPGPKMYSSGEGINPNGVAVSWEGSGPGNPLVVNVSSSPCTPLDADQAAQYNAYMQHQHTMGPYRDTPPQSAPATQQHFPRPPLMQSLQAPSQLLAQCKASHIRRPSLPDGAHTLPLDTLNSMQQWQFSVPMFNAAGDLEMSQPMQLDMLNGTEQPEPQRQTANSTPGSTSSPVPSSIVKPDFSIHQYSPPQIYETTPPPSSDFVGPKVYHFSNAGPGDFQVKQE